MSCFSMRFLIRNDLTILLGLYFFSLPLGKTLWYPLFVMAFVGAVLFFRELFFEKKLSEGSLVLLNGGALIFVPALLSLLTSIDYSRSMTFIGTYPLFFLAGYFIYRRTTELASLKKLLYSLLTIFTLWGALVFWQFVDPSSPFSSNGGSHYQGIFSPNSLVKSSLGLGFILGTAFAFIVTGLWSLRRYKLSAVAAAVLILLCILSGTRSSWVSLLFVFVSGLAILLKQNYEDFYSLLLSSKRRVASTIVVISITLLVSFLTLQNTPKFTQTVKAFDTFSYENLDVALSGRVSLWDDAVEVGKTSPLTGVGVDNFRYAQPLLNEPAGQEWGWISDADPKSGHSLIGASHTHQFLLEAWAGAGAIGVIGLLLMYVYLARFTIQAIKNSSLVAIGTLLSFWAAFQPFNTQNNLYGGWTTAWYWVWLGLAVGFVYRSKTKANQPTD